jgi:hypothetical protein
LYLESELLVMGLIVGFYNGLVALTNNSDSICKKVTTRDLVESTQVGETGGTDLATVRPLATVTDQEHTHLTLGSLNSGVCLTRGNGITLGEEQEVVDESLHILLHGGTGRRHDLVVLHTHGASGHLVQALVDNAEGLAELLHTAEITVVAVTVDTDGHIELDLVIGIVRLRLADVPWDTGATEHDTSETHVQRIGGAHNTNALSSGLPDTVIGEEFLGFVDTVTELGSPLVDIVKETEGNVLRNTTGADIGSVETGTGYSLVEFLLKQPFLVNRGSITLYTQEDLVP